MNGKMRETTIALCEAAMMIALGCILNFLYLWRLPQGGSVDLAMLPVAIFCARRGPLWGLGSGIVFGVLQYLLGSSGAIHWAALIADYLVAFGLMGLGAGLFYQRKNGMVLGAVSGSLLRFFAHYISGVFIWAEYMPEEFFGLTMTTPWFYSLLYNGSYILIDAALMIVVLNVLKKPLHRYLSREDILKRA